MFRQVALGAALLATGMVGSANAVRVVNTGGPLLSETHVTENLKFFQTGAAATVFNDIPGAVVTQAVIPNAGTDNDGNPIVGNGRLFIVNFNAQTECFGPGGTAFCLIRVVATRPGSATRIFHPVNPGGEYRMDTDIAGAVTDGSEGHHYAAALRIPPGGGAWTIRVQRRNNLATTTSSYFGYSMNVRVLD
jgi:hypothetical protein